MSTTQLLSDYQQTSWTRIEDAIRTAISADTWERMPTVFLETFQAECQRDADMLIANDDAVQVFLKLKQRDLSKPKFPQNLAARLEKLHSESMNNLLNSLLFIVDREGLCGKVASSMADALSILHAFHPQWKEPDQFHAPKVAFTLWRLQKCDDFFPSIVGAMYANLHSLRMYHHSSKGNPATDEIWLSHSITKEPDLIVRMETLGQLVQTEPEKVFAAFLEQREAIDVSSLETLLIEPGIRHEWLKQHRAIS